MPPLAIDAFFYGHTHLKKVETNADGILICNAGSITFPKGGNPKTFAIYENGKVEIVEL
jgi:predicted phosphodiesterase